ncbi:MAG: ABC transporter substrate-binding protein, partial [Rhodospirillaceae bacterium]|nr:ABC transporter substrate-binding protein [Rhodospirillaceae bacterium]
MGIANHMTAKCVALLSALLVAIASPNAETLRIGVATRTPGLGNPFASMISGGVHPSTLIFDALVQIDEAGRVVPVLATSWENTSPVTWVFRLREDISFANGEPFNASTVVAIIAYLKTAAAQRYFVSGEVARIATVKAVDDYTVEFRTDSPDAIFPKRLVMILMVPERAWLELGPDDFGLQPIGTGPFSLVDWGMDSGRARFVRNPTSWRNVRQLTGIEFAIIGESVSRAQALVSDQIDIAYGLEFEALRQLKEDGYRTLVKETPIVGALALPNIDPEHPLADVRVRRALNYGTNRQLIA